MDNGYHSIMLISDKHGEKFLYYKNKETIERIMTTNPENFYDDAVAWQERLFRNEYKIILGDD